jgi:hypothetical protein
MRLFIAMDVRNFTAHQPVAPDKIIVPVAQAPLEYQSSFCPRCLIRGRSQEIAYRPQLFVLGDLDQIKLLDERWAFCQERPDLCRCWRRSQRYEQAWKVVFLHERPKFRFEFIPVQNCWLSASN